MKNIGKIAGIVVAAAAIIAAGIYLAGIIGDENAGVDVSHTDCDQIASARQAIKDELDQRKSVAEQQYNTAMEAASDAYWDEYNRLEAAKYACDTDALLADPCKNSFEESYRLGQIAINDPTDANTNAYNAAKQAWQDCQDNPPEDSTYEGKKAKCEADFNSGVAAAQAKRDQSEAQAADARSNALNQAENQFQEKSGIIDAIEKECSQPPTVTQVTAGPITTGSTGTTVQSGSAACTGSFTGYDPEIQNEINRLRQLYQQAAAGNKTSGIGGTDALGAKINELRQQMAQGGHKCKSNADCGDPQPICCSGTQVGKVICSDGVCANETTDCEEDEVCAGTPAQCVSATTGAESMPLIVQKTIAITQPCNNKIQSLDMQPATAESARFEITGNIPSWLSFSPPGAAFPQSVDVNADCPALKSMGPGVYAARGSITVYNKKNELINTMPLVVIITVVGADEDTGAGVTTGGGTVITTPQVSLEPAQVSFTYDHQKPQCPLPINQVMVNAPAGSTWTLTNNLPIWLSMSQTSADVSQPIQMSFPCRLNQYQDQTQSFTAQISVTLPDGTKENVSFTVNGSFTNF